MFRTHLIWQPGKFYISQYGRFFQIKLSSASPKMDHYPQQDQNAKDKMCEILIEFKAGFTNPVAHLPFQCSSNVRRWRWMKFSRALKEFAEGEIFWEAEGPTSHPEAGRGGRALTCPHISGKMPFQGSYAWRKAAMCSLAIWPACHHAILHHERL